MILMDINFTNFSTDLITWSMTPYTNQLGNYVWIAIFSLVIGFTFVSTKNIGSTVAVIFITFACFGATNTFLNNPEFSLFFSVIAIAGVAGTILSLFMRNRRVD